MSVATEPKLAGYPPRAKLGDFLLGEVYQTASLMGKLTDTPCKMTCTAALSDRATFDVTYYGIKLGSAMLTQEGWSWQ